MKVYIVAVNPIHLFTFRIPCAARLHDAVAWHTSYAGHSKQSHHRRRAFPSLNYKNPEHRRNAIASMRCTHAHGHRILASTRSTTFFPSSLRTGPFPLSHSLYLPLSLLAVRFAVPRCHFQHFGKRKQPHVDFYSALATSRVPVAVCVSLGAWACVCLCVCICQLLSLLVPFFLLARRIYNTCINIYFFAQT